MKKICLSCKKKFEGKANAKTCSPKCRKRLERTLKRTDSESHKLEQRVGELGRNVLKSFKNKLLEIETLDHELADNQAGFAVIPHVPPTYTNLVVREDASNTPSSSVAQVVQERAAESVPVKVIPVAQAPTEEVKAPKTAKAESARVTSPVATEVTKTVTPTTNTAEPSKAGQSSLTDWSLPEYELESSGLPMAESLEPVEQAATIEPSTPAESKVETPVAQTTETELPTASSLESSTESPQVDRTNSIANFIDNEPKPEGKKKSFLGGAIFKVAGAALALTMLVGGVGLKLANRSTGSNASQQYPNQSASSAVSGLVNGFSSANANEVAELQVNGNGTFTGNIKAANFSGSGSQLVSLNANNISSGSISDARLSANVTLQGNVFNGSSQLVRTDSQGRLPAIDGSQLINIPGSSVDPNTTIQGNIFNGASQLVQLDSSGYLPALNGSLLTNLEASSIASGTLNDSRLSTNVTIQGNIFNGASQLVQLNLSGDLPAVSGINLTNLNASNVSAGTLNDLRLSTNVTIQGNTFNGANQLVQLSPLGFYPSLNGSLITNIAAGNIVTGTLSDSRLSANVALLNSSQSFTGTNTFSNSVVAPGLQSSGAILDVGTAGATLNLLGDLSSNLAVKSGAYTTTIGFSGSPAGDVNYIFDVAATPGTYTICTDIGNCAGSGSGVTTLGGSVNKLAKFSATQAIANSMISDDGTTVTVQPTANSTNSFQIQNLAGTSNLLVADTSNTRIGIGKAPTTGTLDVNGSIYQNGYQVCDSSGNCVGTGGGGSIGGGGTNGTISMFTGTGYTVADSILSQVSATVTATGDLNVTGQYKVNGSQLASTDLADSSDLAKLSGTGPQTFTGNNKFTGTLVAQNSVNSTTAFQIQNAAGSSNLFVADTTNNRVGIGTLPGYTLDVNGDINIAAGSSYRINGVAICGPSAVCAPASGSSNYIQNSVVAQTNANFNIMSVNSGSVVGILRGASGQTADLLRLQDENGANVVAFANDGALTLGQTSVASGVVKLTNTGGSGTIALSPSNPGSSNYTLTLPAETGTVCTTASLCAGYGAASGSGSYIQNTTSLQSSANFNISGNGTIVGQLRVGDPATATGTVLFYNTSGSGSITVTPANPGSGSYTLTLPAETGTVCTTGSVCSGYASSAAFIQNGNSFGTTATLGTNDSNNLAFETNNTARLIINNTGEIRTESNDIKLKVNGDAAHGLGYYGTGKTYNSIAVDGPVLYGYSGGILGGSQTYGQPGALRWSNDARVVIGNVANIADAQLQVVSRSVSSGAVTMTASNGATTFTTSSSSTLKAGDYIVPTTSTGQARQVATTAFGTTFTVTKAFSANVTAETYTVYPAVLKVTSTSGSTRLSVQGYTGFVGINTTTPENPLNVNTATTADSAAQTLIATGGTGNKGLVVQGVSSQSANLAEFQTYTGALPLKITSAGAITSMDTGASYYQTTLDQGKIQLYAVGDSITSSIYQQNNSTLLLSGSNGTTVAGLSGGTAVALTVNNGTSTGNILNLQDNGSDVATIADGGATLFKNSTNSTTAFQVKNAAGTSYALNVDTSNTRVGIGTNAPSSGLDVVQAANGSAYGISVGVTPGSPAIQLYETLGYTQIAIAPNNDFSVGTISSGAGRATFQAGRDVNISSYDNGGNGVIKLNIGGSTLASLSRTAALSVGSTTTAGSLVVSDGSSNTVTLTASGVGTNYSLTLPTAAGSTSQCLQTDSVTASQLVFGSCGGSSGVTTVGALDGGTANANGATISGSNIYLQSASASYAGLVNTTTQAFAGDKSFNDNVTLAASKSLTVTGGNTASRPASPTEGMVYYDTTTKQLLTYANGKWQADRSTASKIVAASNSSQALKDSADYLATGTSDQTIINTALTAASGGKVYLAEGTYTLSAAVSIPNNTTLAGAGSGTLITLPNSQNGTYKMLTNTDATTGTGVVIRDLRIDGNKSNQSSGAMEGIYFDNMGGGSGSSARTGGVIENVVVKNIYAGNGIYLNASNNNRVANTLTQGNTTWGGIYLVSSSYNTVVGNIAEGNSNYGIILNTNSYGNSLTGNVVQGNTSYGLFIISSSYTAITNNTVIGNGTSGIYLSSSTLSTISGNVVQGNSSSGIIIEASTENTVTGNTVQNNASRGINLASAANKNTISGNTLTDNGGSTTNEAIVINASDYNSITSNTINDSACTSNCYAIDISNSTSDKNYLSGNRFSGSSANAATINDVGTNTIYNGQQTNSSTSTNSDVTDFRFRGSANSSTAFAVLNSTGSSIFNVNSSTAGITVSGALASTGGTIDLNASSNNNTNINTGTSTGAVTIGNSAAGAIAIQSASTIAITGTTTVTALSGGSTKALIVNNSTSTGNILEAQDNGTAVFSVADGGAVLAKNSVDSTTAFRVQASSGTSLFIVDTTNSSTIINRATDGTLVDLQVAGVSQGSITVASGTVSYNAFTGSHYGLFSSGSAANAGELVDLTGTNSYRDGSHEPIYGIIRSSTPNSPNILGAYLSTSNPDQAPGSNNPELIMAAGNGDVWVADNGSGNVSIGDPLLSSSVAGYAMRDPGTYAVSHIFAKAAENIDWSQVTTLVSGVKAAKISVLFSYYDRDNTNNQLHAESIEVMNSAIFGGDVSIASSLNVSGATVLSSLTVSGTATLANLKVTGNLEVASIKVNGKIITGGNAPTISAGVGAGTADSLNSIATPVVNVVGNDTSGTITVTVGANTAADELVKLVFASSFSNKPRVVLTPGNRDSAGLGLYYDEANSTKDGLSVLSSNAPETGKTYVFTYLIVE